MILLMSEKDYGWSRKKDQLINQLLDKFIDQSTNQINQSIIKCWMGVSGKEKNELGV